LCVANMEGKASRVPTLAELSTRMVCQHTDTHVIPLLKSRGGLTGDDARWSCYGGGTAETTGVGGVPLEVVLHILLQLKIDGKYDEEKHFFSFIKKDATCFELKRSRCGWEITDEMVPLFISPRGCRDTLFSLVLSDCSITDAGMTLLLQHCSHLRSLRLSWCDHITDRTLQSIGKANKLGELSVRGCANTTKLGIQFVVSHCKALETLHTSSGDDAMLKQLAKTCNSLQVLDLEGSSDVSDDGIRYLSKSANLLAKLKELGLQKCKHITDNGVKALTKFQYLETLNLTSCEKITDAGLKYIAKSQFLRKSLMHLDFSGCFLVGPGGVEELVDHAMCLRVLGLKGCTNISKNLVAKLQKKMPLLKIEV